MPAKRRTGRDTCCYICAKHKTRECPARLPCLRNPETCENQIFDGERCCVCRSFQPKEPTK